MMKRILLGLMMALSLCVQATELTKDYNVAFRYGGQDFQPDQWAPQTHQVDDQTTQQIYTSPDGKLRLTLTYLIYKDFPVTEVHPTLECLADDQTDIIDQFRTLSISQPCQSQGIRIRRVTGAMTVLSDFSRHDVLLQRRHECDILHFGTCEGRSSSAWLPYFGIDLDPMSGLEIAIGWSGTWQVDMQYAENLNLSLGMQDPIHFRMRKGESFNMPYVVIYQRQGKSAEDGLVEFHRFVIEHKSPRDSKGKLFEPLLPLTASGGNKTDENMLKVLEYGTEHFQVPFNAFWVDAGWNGPKKETVQDQNCGPDWYGIVGDWTVNTWPHPDGNMRKVADAAHKKGMRFLLWFEAERATEQTPVVKQHPEYFHRTRNSTDPNNYLLDLGNPEARKWIVDEVSRNIRETGIDIYRQDFNMDPLPIWRDNDAEDRQGVNEIRHINGLYAYWDELHRLFPDLMFENCASGGRRMDIEMMSRSHSYCRDDAHMMADNDNMTQNITLNSTQYIPFTGGETFTVPIFDTYSFLSKLGAGTVFTPTDFNGMILKREPDQKELDWFNKVLGIANRVRPLFMGDFYPLTDASFDANDIYCGYQLNDAKNGRGCFILFRRPECTQSTFDLHLRGIDPNALYTVETFQGKTVKMKGSQLSNQTLKFSQPKAYRVVFYQACSIN